MSEPIRQLAAIMFTDIVGYTALMGADSKRALDLVRVNKEILKPIVEKHNGNWVKEMGDGSLSYFNSALDAVNCAVEIQETAIDTIDAKLRIGVHLGDVTIQNMDVYGDGVNVASRLESIADPGGIYISDATQKAIQGQSDFETKYLGRKKLKNVAYPVQTYAIQGKGLPVAKKKSFWQNLHESKNFGIIIFLVTLFFGLVFREILSFVLTRLNITPVWSEIFLYTIILFLPTMASFLFIPVDKSRFFRIARRLIPPVNMLAAAVTLVIMFWGRELGAMTANVTYEDELGNTREVTVLKNEFVKNILIFPFEPMERVGKNGLDDDKAWQGKGIAEAIKQNMRQHQSLLATVGEENVSLNEKFQSKSGFHPDYFLLGRYQWVGDSLQSELKIYGKNAKVFYENRLMAGTLFEMSDIIKKTLIDQLDLHQIEEDHIELPFTAFITDNEQAFRQWVLGNNKAARMEDPYYAYAYLRELDDAFFYGFGDEYKKQLVKEGMAVMKKLPEADQLKFKVYYFLSLKEKDKANRAYEKFVSLYPGNHNILKAYIEFLGSNGYYKEAIELSIEQITKTNDPFFSEVIYRLVLLFGNTEELNELESGITKSKLLMSQYHYQLLMGEIALTRGNLTIARDIFQDVLLEKPLFYTVDSVIKVIDFLEQADTVELQNFITSISGTYINEADDQIIDIKYQNEQLTEFWGGQLPYLTRVIDQSSTYRAWIFLDDQPQYRRTYIYGIHGQTLKAKYVQQNSSKVKPFTRYHYKATPELIEALEAFRQRNYAKADSLFQQTLAYDSGYYFTKNFIEASRFSSNEASVKLQNLLHGKRFITDEKYSAYLEFSYHNDLFLLNTGGAPHDIYPINESWIMDAYNKSYKFNVLSNTSNLSVEQYTYDNEKNEFQKTHTYHEANE
jgi:class 3 adenylate cyclase